MKVVLALGGNALIRRGERPETGVQRRNLHRAGGPLAEVARDHAVVVTHGNGPQVGLLALQAEAYEKSSAEGVRSYPLDVLGAGTEGMIGYMLEQELRVRLPGREVATLLTQVVVERDDPAFAEPTKPIGPVYEPERGRALAEERGWTMIEEETGEGLRLRRAVASPTPRRILEIETIRLLTEAGHLVVCGGGGGVPVTVDADGNLRGCEAVVDKDRTAGLLARELEADLLVLLTDVDGIYRDFPDNADRIERLTPDELRALELPPGSMRPKAEALADFVEATGGRGAIGSLEQAAAVVAGRAGTQVEG